MNETQNIPWKRISVEAAAIVASILLAFAIDAWWSARQLAVEEQELLSQLKTESEVNSVLLAESREFHEALLETTQSLLDVTGPDATTNITEMDDFKRYLAEMLRWRTFDPQTGVLTGIIQSGKLGVIRSDRLRAALASWPAKVHDLVEDEVFAVDFTEQIVRPYFSSNTSIREFDHGGSFTSSNFTGDFEEMLTDREFENLVVIKHRLTIAVLTEYDNLRPFIDEILRLIGAETETNE